MNKLTELNYRLKLRKQLTKATNELLEITNEEVKREKERRFNQTKRKN